MPDSDLSTKYQLTFDERERYLYAFIEGDQDSVEISRSYWQEVARETTRTGMKRVMIEENLPAGASMTEMFQFATEIPNMGFGGTRIAFIDRDLTQNDLNQFGELVAVNRGVNIKVFIDKQEAETWLLDSDEI